MRPLIIRLPYRTIRYEVVKSFSIFENKSDPTSPPFQFLLRPEYGIGVQSMAVGAATQAELGAVIRLCPMFRWVEALKALTAATCTLAKLQLPDSRFADGGDYPILDLREHTMAGKGDWEKECEKARQRVENPGRERVIDLEEGEQRPMLPDVVQDSQPQPAIPSPSELPVGNASQPVWVPRVVGAMEQFLSSIDGLDDEEIQRRVHNMGFDMLHAVRSSQAQIPADRDRQFAQVMSEQQARLQAQAAAAAAEASPVQPPPSRTPRGTTDLSVIVRQLREAAGESIEWRDVSQQPPDAPLPLRTQTEIVQDEIDDAR